MVCLGCVAARGWMVQWSRSTEEYGPPWDACLAGGAGAHMGALTPFPAPGLATRQRSRVATQRKAGGWIGCSLFGGNVARCGGFGR